MNWLGIDTCLGACSVVVRREPPYGGRSVWSERRLMTSGHAEALAPMMVDVMERASLPFRSIGRILVTHGPGTFTGVRVGVGAARALAVSLRVPAVGCSSLHPLAVLALRRVPGAGGNDTALLVVRDAGRGVLLAEAFDVDAWSLTGPQRITPAEAAGLCPGRRLIAVGEGADAVAEAARSLGRSVEADWRDHLSAADLEPDIACMAALMERFVPSRAPPRPLYLRPPDAKPPAGASIERKPQ